MRDELAKSVVLESEGRHSRSSFTDDPPQVFVGMGVQPVEDSRPDFSSGAVAPVASRAGVLVDAAAILGRESEGKEC
jgi:hypothetical protein